MRPIPRIGLHHNVRKVTRTTGKLLSKYAQPSPDSLVADSPAQRILIHHFGARGVNEIRAWPHRVEELCIDHPARLGAQRHVNADYIRRGSYFQAGRPISNTQTLGDL